MNALNIALKDIQIFLKDRANLVQLLLLPFVFILVFVSATGGFEDEEENLITLPVVNLDPTGEAAQNLIDGLNAAGGIKVRLYDDEAEAKTKLEEAGILQLLTIPAGFGEDVAAGRPVTLRLINHPDADETEAKAVQRVISGVAQGMSLGAQLLASLAQMGDMQAATPTELQVFTPEKNLAQAQSQFERSQTAPLVVVEQTRPQSLEEDVPDPNAIQQNVPGYTIIFVFVTAQATAASIYTEKRVGSFRRLLAAPISKAELLVGKMIPNFVTALIQVIIIFGAGVLLFPALGFEGLTLGDDPLALVLVTLLIALCSTGMGILIAAIARTEAQIGGMATLALWTMGALGGCLFPPFLLGGLASIGRVVPHYWAIQAYHDLIVRGRGLADVTTEMLALLGFTALFFAIGLWRFEFD